MVGKTACNDARDRDTSNTAPTPHLPLEELERSRAKLEPDLHGPTLLQGLRVCPQIAAGSKITKGSVSGRVRNAR